MSQNLKCTDSLRPDQMEDLVKLMANKRFALLNDPGVGKTPVACLYFYWIWSMFQERTVWVMPKSIRKKNREELLKWSEFSPDDVLIWEGEDIPQTQNPKVFIMTFARWRLSWKKLLMRFQDINCLSGDETQLGWKGAGSQTVSSLFQSMRYIERFVPMTGTLVAGTLASAYPVIHLLNPNYYTGYDHFMAEHALLDDWGKVVGWTNHLKLGQILMAHATSRSFEEVHGKKNMVLQTEQVEMAPLQREKYDEWEANALLELDDRFMEAATGGVATIRCRQIMAHPENVKLPTAHDDAGKPIAWKTYNLVGKERTGKDEQLLLHLEDHKRTGQPLVVFGTFIAEMDRIGELVKSVGLSCGVVHSKINDKRCQQNLDDFEQRKLDVLVVSPTKAGAGLNWPFLNHMIFASLDYQDDHFKQAIFRAMRGVRPHPLRITILEYEKSIDQAIMAIIERKSRDAEGVDPTKGSISFHKPKPAPDPVPVPANKTKFSIEDFKRVRQRAAPKKGCKG